MYPANRVVDRHEGDRNPEERAAEQVIDTASRRRFRRQQDRQSDEGKGETLVFDPLTPQHVGKTEGSDGEKPGEDSPEKERCGPRPPRHFFLPARVATDERLRGCRIGEAQPGRRIGAPDFPLPVIGCGGEILRRGDVRDQVAHHAR